jgi:serine/threonine protein kinase
MSEGWHDESRKSEPAGAEVSAGSDTPSGDGSWQDDDLVEDDPRIMRIIEEVIDRRHRGEAVSSDEIMAGNPELMPALGKALSDLEAIHRAVLSVRMPGESNPPGRSPPTISNLPSDSSDLATEGEKPRALRIWGYVVVEEISEGGQATVFKAVQERTGRTVAVKVIHGGPFAGSRRRSRFYRESAILARLNHPNVVGIIDQGRTEDGSFFLVMDFVDGVSLDHYVAQLGKDTAAIVKLFVKIADAVEEAHRHGIVHRDLKPMNILVDQRGEPHILDFGMARLLNDGEDGDRQTTLTRTGQILGSLPWSSPEQVAGLKSAIGPATDVYALGVMLFRCLTGDFPYPTKGSPNSVTRHILSTAPGPVAYLAERNGIGVTAQLEAVVQKALAKSPGERYKSAGKLARDLGVCLRGGVPSIPRRRWRGFVWKL